MSTRRIARLVVLFIMAGFALAIVFYLATFMLQQSNAGDSSSLTLFSLCSVGGIILLMIWLGLRFIRHISRGMQGGMMQGYRRQYRNEE